MEMATSCFLKCVKIQLVVWEQSVTRCKVMRFFKEFFRVNYEIASSIFQLKRRVLRHHVLAVDVLTRNGIDSSKLFAYVNSTFATSHLYQLVN